MAKKKENLEPRRKRMKRDARLQNAKTWLRDFEGKNVIKSYCNWFGVDAFCAVTELELLGLRFSEKQKMNINKRQEDRIRQKQLMKARKLHKEQIQELEEYYGGFEFVEDFTGGGAPFGVSYCELEAIEVRKRKHEDMVSSLTDPSLHWVGDLL